MLFVETDRQTKKYSKRLEMPIDEKERGGKEQKSLYHLKTSTADKT